jgi:hypothetical protein
VIETFVPAPGDNRPGHPPRVEPRSIVGVETCDLPVAKALVEGDRGQIRDGGLELHPLDAGCAKPPFEIDQELSAQALPPGRGRHVERDDVSLRSARPPPEHEGDDPTVTLGHDGLGSLPRQESSQLGSRICDAGREACPIELPDGLEVRATVFAEDAWAQAHRGLRLGMVPPEKE